MTRLTCTLRRLIASQGRRDEGVALVSVIGLMAVLGVMIVAIAGATMFTVGQTTMTRASVQAKAAAEAGIDQVRAMLADTTWTCPTGGTVSAAGDAPFIVQIKVSTTSTADTRSTPGCPSTSTRSIFLESTGYATAKGLGRTGGDARVMNALISKPVSSPRFNHAIYGKNGVELSNSLGLVNSDRKGDVLTSGDLKCHAGAKIAGSLYVGGKLTFENGGCEVDGDVFVTGDFASSGGCVVRGNLYVKGSAKVANDNCPIMGDMWVDGNVTVSTAGARLGTNLFAGGNLVTSSVLSSPTQTITLRGGVSADSWTTTQIRNSYGARLVEGGTVAPAPTLAPDSIEPYPELAVADPMFAGWRPESWKSSLTAAGVNSWMTGNMLCSLDGGSFTGEINVRVNTVFNTMTECPSGMAFGSGLKLRLDADMVIFATNFTLTGNVTIYPGASGVKHSLYLITPWTGSCRAGAAPVQFRNGTWTQDPAISALIYSNGLMEFNTGQNIYGQLYGCQIKTHTGTNLFYSPVGSTADPALTPWSLTYIKDR